MRRLLLLTEGLSDVLTAKTAVCLLRYRPEQVVAVLDSHLTGQTAQQIFGTGGAIPIVGDTAEAPEANTLVIGIAPPGGRLPESMRKIVLAALARGMNVESGLHDFLSHDREFVAAARAGGGMLRDVRKSDERDVASGRPFDPRCFRLHTVGADCSVGKMVASVELTLAFRRLGHDAKFVATGQTGILIEGDGCAVDGVVVDFIAGASEKLVRVNEHRSILIIEGQGSLAHPRYSAVSLGLLHGTRPDALILCYEAGRTHVHGMPDVPLAPLARIVELNQTMAAAVSACRVIGVAANTRRLDARAADDEIRRVSDELQLPACDCIRQGPDVLVGAALAERQRLKRFG